MKIGHMKIGPWKRNPRAGQSAVTIAVALVALLGFVGLALDVGLVMIARNELQNAADAAALAGASEFYKGTTTPPNWTRGQDSAAKAVTRNKVMNTSLATGTYQMGYWNMTGTPSGMQSKTKTPLLATDRPAIKVTITKASGSNGGAINLVLAPLVGVSTMNLKASAVAVVSYPGTVAPGQLLPVAISKCLYDNYWDVATNSPKIDPATNQPYEFKITSSYHTGPCEAGQWTSFKEDVNNVPAVRDLIANGNPTPLSVGDSIWIEPGTKTTLYSSIPVPSDVFLPVVIDISTHAKNVVVGFGAFHIDASVGGSGKYIQGHFISGQILPISNTGGPSYGAVSPPTLAQ